MLNVLVNAYAVSPNWGSEPGMGWNWVSNLAKYCNLYVVTEGEWKVEIEDALKSHPYAANLHFFYLPVSERVRRMCWNQGDWRFYYHYRKWQKAALDLERIIISDCVRKSTATGVHHDIDVVHHLNMIGFREPGYEWKIKDIPFVWGPIGGCELMPVNFLDGESLKFKFAVSVKNCLNRLQRKYQYRFRKALNRANGLSAATKGVWEFIRSYHKKDIVLLNETGCYVKTLPTKAVKEDSLDILWVGKFDFRKQLGLALEIMGALKDCKNVKLHIVGSGSEAEVARYKQMTDKLQIGDKVVWHGKIPNADVHRLMRECDLFLFTSIMEGTPHVVLEAIQNALPVICFDICGQSGVVSDSVGIKIPLTTKRQAVRDFTDAISYLYSHRAIIRDLSENCAIRQKELSWDNKAVEMIGIYNNAISGFSR